MADCFSSTEMAALQEKLIEFEGIRYKAYDAQPNSGTVDWTIGVGFNLKRSEARTVFNKVLPDVDFDSVYKGDTTLTKTQCMKLFEHDLTDTYIPRAKEVAGEKFSEFPLNVRIAIVNAVYRGDLKYSHKTAQYIRAGDWGKVPAEYLDHNDYKYSEERGIPGVRVRMDWNADQFRTMNK